MKRKIGSGILALGLIVVSLIGCSSGNSSTSSSGGENYTSHNAAQNTEADDTANSGTEENLTKQEENAQMGTEDGLPTVYMTTDISPEGLMAAYEALGVTIDAENVAIKLSTGETGSNYLDPALIQDLVQTLNGTIVDRKSVV